MPLAQLLVSADVPAAALDRLAHEIGGIVATIGRLDPAAATEPVPIDEGWAEWSAELPAFVAAIEPVLDADARAEVDRFLVTPPPRAQPPERLVLTHNDLGAEHVLVDPVTLAVTGIIDWSDAAVADVAGEVGRLLRDLGADHLEGVLQGVGVTATERDGLLERAWWVARCLVIEDLAYALEHRPDLVAHELTGLRRTLRPSGHGDDGTERLSCPPGQPPR